nr:MAG TPA_asm: hypothetical protein [Caudoviricetes sp.]
MRQQVFYLSKLFYLACCGLFKAKNSSTLSLKTVRRTVFLTLAFESLLTHNGKIKRKHPFGYFLFWCANRDSNPNKNGLNTDA